MSVAPSGPPKKRGSAGTVYGRGRKSTSFVFNSRKAKTPKILQFEDIPYKRRKITNSNVSINAFNEKAEVYSRLIELENSLDSHLRDERKNLQQLFNSTPNSIKGILRIHIYNTSSKQQPDEQPIWSLRIQGRLIWPDLAQTVFQTVPSAWICS